MAFDPDAFLKKLDAAESAPPAAAPAFDPDAFLAKLDEQERMANLPEYFQGLPMDTIEAIKQKVPMRTRGQGGVENQRRRLANLEKLRLKNPALAEEIETMPAWQSAAIGYGKTSRDLAAGLGSALESPANTLEGLGIDPNTLGPIGAILGGARTIGSSLPEPEATPEAYQALSELRPSAQIGEIAGEAVPALGIGVAGGAIPGLAARTGAMAAAEGVQQGLQSVGRDESASEVAKNVAIGAAFGAGGELAIPVLRKYGGELFRKLTGRAPKSNIILEDRTITDEFKKVLEKEGYTEDDFRRAVSQMNEGESVRNRIGVDDIPEQVPSNTPEPSLERMVSSSDIPPDADPNRVARNRQRQEAFERMDLTPTEAQRTRSPNLFKDQQDMIKYDEQVRYAIETQDRKLFEQATARAEQARAGATTEDSVSNVILNRTRQRDLEINQAYEDLAARAGDKPVMVFSELTKKVNQFLGEDELTAGAVNAVRKRMIDSGIIDKYGKLKQVKPDNTLLTANKPWEPERFTVKKAEKLRQYMNDLYAHIPADKPRGRQLINQLKKALDADSYASTGDDIFKQARDAHYAKEQGLSKQRASEYSRNKVSLVRDILQDKVAGEDLFRKVTGARSKYKAADLIDLKRYLLEEDPTDVEAGLRAWNNIRADALEHIRDLSSKGPESEEGFKSITRAGLDQAFRSIGDSKMRVLFNADERKFLANLAEVARYREPISGTALGSGPSGDAVRQLNGTITQWLSGGGQVTATLVTALKRLEGTIDNAIKRKKVLTLIDDAEKLQKLQEAQEAKLFRGTRAGRAAGGAAQAAATGALPAYETYQEFNDSE